MLRYTFEVNRLLTCLLSSSVKIISIPMAQAVVLYAELNIVSVLTVALACHCGRGECGGKQATKTSTNNGMHT